MPKSGCNSSGEDSVPPRPTTMKVLNSWFTERSQRSRNWTLASTRLAGRKARLLARSRSGGEDSMVPVAKRTLVVSEEIIGGVDDVAVLPAAGEVVGADQAVVQDDEIRVDEDIASAVIGLVGQGDETGVGLNVAIEQKEELADTQGDVARRSRRPRY